ncbi:DUF397 domain-containing protein [Streptomyces sp. NPDC006643]|uniref:DUF397 domain-containing protein n=1 Tax=Streptomyces sp. NPDC006643 TaxID=3364756 RepID=UPI00368B31BD
MPPTARRSRPPAPARAPSHRRRRHHGTPVRDSKDPHIGRLTLSPAAWAAFTTHLAAR